MDAPVEVPIAAFAPTPPRLDATSFVRGAIVVLVPALLALWCLVLVQQLFVFTEARQLISPDRRFDLLRFVALPELDWGNTRQTGTLVFMTVGTVCGLDPACVNTGTALLTAVAAVLAIILAWQLTGSAWLAALAAVLWGFSAPVLSVWIWQATWYDLLATIVAFGAGAFWWAALGRRTLSPLAMVGVSAASVVLLMVGFNAKEIDYHLAGVLVLLAVVRGAATDGAIRRNLLIAAAPVVYACWFIAYALLHTDPTYAAQVGKREILDGLKLLITQALGISRHSSFLDQQGPVADGIRMAAAALHALFWAALATAALVAGARAWPWHRPVSLRALAAGRGAELYLVAVMVVTLLVGARSMGASAYYVLTPWFAAIVLTLLVIRRVARRLPRSRVVGGILTGLFVLAATVGYVGAFAPTATVPHVIADSARWRSSLAMIRTLLDGRDVRSVAWRSDGNAASAFYVLRDPGYFGPMPEERYAVGSDLWPWVVGQRTGVKVEGLTHGSAAEWQARAGDLAAPGQVLIVTTDDYGLALVAHEGTILFTVPTPAS